LHHFERWEERGGEGRAAYLLASIDLGETLGTSLLLRLALLQEGLRDQNIVLSGDGAVACQIST